jgi:large subunit ribosomal protein L23
MSSVKRSMYGILRQPKITEKTALLGTKSNTVVFDVHPKANKSDIKNAVEKLFDVKVEVVRTVNGLGKVRRVKAQAGRQRAWKKAYVTLKEGSSIDVIEGL